MTEKKDSMKALMERLDGPRDLPDLPDWDSMYDDAIEELGALPFLYDDGDDLDEYY